MAMVRVLLHLGAAFLTIAAIHAAPSKRYYQRQDGDFNLQAKLDNFLFVLIYPSEASFVQKVIQAIAFNDNLLTNVFPTASAKSHGSDGSVTSEANDEEPHTTQNVLLDGDSTDKEGLKDATEKNTEVPSILSLQQAEMPTDKKEQDEKVDSVARTAKNVRGFELKSHEVPMILGYLVDLRRSLGAKMEMDDRALNVIGNVWNPDVEFGKPGTSLKKQLFRRENVVESAAPSLKIDKRDVTFSEEKKKKQQEELRLLGDSIENCGPGRRRDANGVCQFDEFATSLQYF